jgi:hypothetical protein
MASGINLSIILLIWLVGLIVGFYMLFPDISKTLQTINTLNISDDRTTALERQNNDDVSYIDYTPLIIIDKIRF